MSREHDRRVNELLLEVLELPPGDRGRFLDRACADEPDLRQELDALLAQEASIGSFLDSPVFGGPVTSREMPATEPKHPEQIGPYRIVDTLGQGGMGIVYLAEQCEPIQRRVALKVIRTGLGSRSARRSFAAERQALARMSHPNIAQVFDAGATDDGEPYVTMEYVRGVPITAHCDLRRLGLAARLQLFRAVCDGIRHAHQKGIIHRDLKPSNILVAEDGTTVTPKIIDFGIAKVLDESRAEQGSPTHAKRIVGTIGYLSPEVLCGQDADTRSDVYSLGLVLYRLLVGILPFDGDQQRKDHSGGVCPPPSARVAGLGEKAETIAAARGLSVSALLRRVRGDLDSINLKALAVDREERYQSAAELAADLERFQAGRPVTAGPDTVRYQLGKAARRHWFGLTSAVLVVLAVLAGLTTTTIAARRARLEADRANLEAEAARAVSDFLVDLFGSADPDRAQGRTVTVTDLLEVGLERTESGLADQPLIRARLRAALGYVHLKLGLMTEAAALLEETLRTREQLLPADHSEVIESLRHLALLYQAQGRYDDAQRLLTRVLSAQEATLDRDHPDVAETLKRLGINAWYRGEAEEAEGLLERSLEILSRAAEPNHRQVARVLNNLGIVHTDRGRLAEAESRFRQALTILEEHLGPEHPDVASCLNNLARGLKTQARYQEAEPLYRRALAIRERVLGPDHPELAGSLNNLANLLIACGDYRQAEPLLERALSVSESALGSNNPGVAVALNNLASLYSHQELPERAEPFLRRALAIWEHSLGPDHPTVATALANLGEVSWRLGRADQAESFLKRSLATLEAVSGRDHPDVAYSLCSLGTIYREQNRLEEAEPLLERALTIRLAALGPGHPAVDDSVAEYTALLHAQGRDDEVTALQARVATPPGQ